MNLISVSPKYQMTIPKEIRKNIDIQPGEKIQVILYKNRIEYIPVKSINNLRGFLKGMNSSLDREEDRI